MAVGTDHFAFGDLVDEVVPAPVTKPFGNVERLVAEVIELEHDRVGLATVNAGMIGEVVDEKCRSLGGEQRASPHRGTDVAIAIACVVLLFVRRPARTAVVVALALGFPPPSELI